MVNCLSIKDNWCHFLQCNGNSWTLPDTDYEFHIRFGTWWTWMLVAARWGYGAYSKLNNAKVEWDLLWSHYLSKLVALPILGCTATEFLFENFWRTACTGNVYIRRTEAKYSAVYFKRHWRNFSPGCFKDEKKVNACLNRWMAWAFPALNTTLLFLISV